MKKIYLWRLWLPIVSLLFFLSLIEFLFRFLITYEDTNKTISGIVEPDPKLIWRLKPKLYGPLATNELGFRDSSYNKDADFYRFMRTMEIYKETLDKETVLVLSTDGEFLKYLGSAK